MLGNSFDSEALKIPLSSVLVFLIPSFFSEIRNKSYGRMKGMAVLLVTEVILRLRFVYMVATFLSRVFQVTKC